MIPPELMAAWERNDAELTRLAQQYKDQIKDIGQDLVKWVRTQRDGTGRIIGDVSFETIQQVFLRAGLQDYAKGLRSLLDEAIATSVETVTATGIPLQVSPVAFRNAMLSEMMVPLGAQTVQIQSSVAAILRGAALIPKPIKQLAMELQAQTGTLYNRSIAIVETSLARVQRRTAHEAAKSIDASERLYLYTGPNDDRTRPFCKARVGKAFTEKQLGRMDNKAGLPVIDSAGGYRCRHSLLPISRSYAKRNGIGLGGA